MSKSWYTYRINRFALTSLVIVVLTINALDLNGQKREAPILLDSALINEQFNLFEFKNINRLALYEDKSKLQRIRSLDKQEKWEELYNTLRDYVSRFGIKNFYYDTYLIWKLAKLTELFGDQEEAKSLYRLVLKHLSTGD